VSLPFSRVDATSASQHLTSKTKEIECCDDINRVCFAVNLTAEPEVNNLPTGSEVVSASLDKNAFYGCIRNGHWAHYLSNSASLQVSIMGVMTAITTTTIVITTKSNPTGTTIAPTAPSLDVHFERMPVSDGAGLPSTSKPQGEREKMPWQRFVSSLNCASNSCGALAYSGPLDAYGDSALLTTIQVPADVVRSKATPLFVRAPKVFGGITPLLS
jgi:hypothetical protein